MSVGTYSLAREGDKLLSPHFRVREFACRDGADLVKIDTDLVELLERIRTATCGAVTVNSGYRTASYNQKVAGARASQHLLGRAADIQVSGASPLLVGQIAEYYLLNPYLTALHCIKCCLMGLWCNSCTASGIYTDFYFRVKCLYRHCIADNTDICTDTDKLHFCISLFANPFCQSC